uniref:Uncharacterized protein n=1 Tax=Mesocestoides corti TaxID=53468 RepID=A0A5K3G1T6_MESCO
MPHGSLLDYLRDGPGRHLTLRPLVDMMAQVCGCLSYPRQLTFCRDSSLSCTDHLYHPLHHHHHHHHYNLCRHPHHLLHHPHHLLHHSHHHPHHHSHHHHLHHPHYHHRLLHRHHILHHDHFLRHHHLLHHHLISISEISFNQSGFNVGVFHFYFHILLVLLSCSLPQRRL